MTNDQYELARLEATFSARQSLAPSSELKERVLMAMRREFKQRESQRILRNDIWRFVATTAAMAILWLNLVMSATNNAYWSLQQSENGQDISAMTEQIRELAPELSESEARCQALLLKAGTRLIFAPNFNPHSLIDWRELSRRSREYEGLM